MNFYKKGLEKIKETTLSSSGTFGTAPNIGNQGGNVGNSDFYAPGNSMAIWGTFLGGKKKKRKKGKIPLYRRNFESVKETTDKELVLDCVIRTRNTTQIDVLKKILEVNNIPFVSESSDTLSFQGYDEIIRDTVDHLQLIIGEGNTIVLIGEMEGGKSEGKTVEDIAKIHNVTVEEIEEELRIGIEVEVEHTNDPAIARVIALDHLTEFPKYYTELKKMENKLKNERK